ncbi:hypothetical protein CLOM621_08720 [Clostridium sp. M62/1]|nr:hypothetical protein CLOM621_08720 [Clostridium sp. M62/1]
MYLCDQVTDRNQVCAYNENRWKQQTETAGSGGGRTAARNMKKGHTV